MELWHSHKLSHKLSTPVGWLSLFLKLQSTLPLCIFGLEVSWTRHPYWVSPPGSQRYKQE